MRGTDKGVLCDLAKSHRVHDVPIGTIATRSQRFGGFAIDFVLIAGPLLAITWAISDVDLRKHVFDTPGWVPWVSVSVQFIYASLMTARDGQTLGKKLMRTRVVTVKRMETPSLRTASIRALPSIVGAVPVLGRLTTLVFVPIAFRADRRGLHDLVAGTSVISADY